MNYKSVVVLIVAVALGGMETVNGQFLKNLGKKVEKAAERTVERRAERETEKKTDQALDKVFEDNGEKKQKQKGETKETAAAKGNDSAEENDATVAKRQSALASFLGGSMEDVPDTYVFSYRATMKIIDENEKEEANVLYWLEPDATYFATEVLADKAAGPVAVIDMDIESMVMFMDDGKKKTAMRLDGNQQLMDKYMKATEDGEADVKITPIESKVILGYRCKGFQMESDDGISKVWITDEAPVGLVNGVNGMMKADYIPEGLPDLGPKALFMAMEYVPKNGKKGSVRMVCTELEKISKIINKKDYQSMTMGGDGD